LVVLRFQYRKILETYIPISCRFLK
jgi:hypothetical protein